VTKTRPGGSIFTRYQGVKFQAVLTAPLLPNYSFGPLEPAKAVDELDRLIGTYISIRDKGYRPDTYGHVTGYFVGDDRGHRFVVGPGNHRVGALAVLGMDRMPARLHSHPAAIHRDQLPLWMPEHGGPFPGAYGRGRVRTSA